MHLLYPDIVGCAARCCQTGRVCQICTSDNALLLSNLATVRPIAQAICIKFFMIYLMPLPVPDRTTVRRRMNIWLTVIRGWWAKVDNSAEPYTGWFGGVEEMRLWHNKNTYIFDIHADSIASLSRCQSYYHNRFNCSRDYVRVFESCGGLTRKLQFNIIYAWRLGCAHHHNLLMR